MARLAAPTRCCRGASSTSACRRRPTTGSRRRRRRADRTRGRWMACGWTGRCASAARPRRAGRATWWPTRRSRRIWPAKPSAVILEGNVELVTDASHPLAGPSAAASRAKYPQYYASETPPPSAAVLGAATEHRLRLDARRLPARRGALDVLSPQCFGRSNHQYVYQNGRGQPGQPDRPQTPLDGGAPSTSAARTVSHMLSARTILSMCSAAHPRQLLLLPHQLSPDPPAAIRPRVHFGGRMDYPTRPLPRFFKVRQDLPRDRVADVVASRARRAAAPRASSSARQPGASVAITAGSRGIADIPLVMRTVVDVVREAGAEPVRRPGHGQPRRRHARGPARTCWPSTASPRQSVGAPIRASHGHRRARARSRAARPSTSTRWPRRPTRRSSSIASRRTPPSAATSRAACAR